MMRCGMCECELSEPEPFCDDCIEAMEGVYQLMNESVSSDTETKED